MKNLFKSFKRSESGSVIFLVALTIMIILFLGVGTIDLGRAYIIKAKLQQASDAAALSAANMPFGTSKADRTAKARKMFGLNFPAGYMGSSIRPSDITITFDGTEADPTAIYVSINEEVKTAFLKFNGKNSVRVATHNGVAIPKTKIIQNDVVIVLDNSGSMRWNAAGAVVSDCGTNVNSICRGRQIRRSLDRFMDNIFVGSAPGASNATNDVFSFGLVIFGSGIDRTLNFTNKKKDVVEAYHTMSWPGSTSGGLGAQEARVRITGTTTYGKRKDSTRFAIIMTDGDNDTVSQDTLMESECTVMKNSGVMVFTIAFGPAVNNPNGRGATVLRNCASLDKNGTKDLTARRAIDEKALDTVFEDIANTIRVLKLIN